MLPVRRIAMLPYLGNPFGAHGCPLRRNILLYSPRTGGLAFLVRVRQEFATNHKRAYVARL